jgi:hypothetical protein
MAAGESMEVVPGKIWAGFSIGMRSRLVGSSLNSVKASASLAALFALTPGKKE